VLYVTKIFNKQTDHLFQGTYLLEKKTVLLKFLLPLINLHQLLEKAGYEQTSWVFFNKPIRNLFWNRCVYGNVFSLMSRQKTLKWPLISLNTEKLRSASADVSDRVHHNTSKILILGKEPGSADTKDSIKYYQVNKPCQTPGTTY